MVFHLLDSINSVDSALVNTIPTSNWFNISYKVIWWNELVLIGIELKEKNYSVKKNHFSLEFDRLFALFCRAHTSQDDNLKCEIVRAIHVFNFNASLHFSSRKIGRRFLILSRYGYLQFSTKKSNIYFGKNKFGYHLPSEIPLTSVILELYRNLSR